MNYLTYFYFIKAKRRLCISAAKELNIPYIVPDKVKNAITFFNHEIPEKVLRSVDNEINHKKLKKSEVIKNINEYNKLIVENNLNIEPMTTKRYMVEIYRPYIKNRRKKKVAKVNINSDFYFSSEWLKLRMVAIKKYGNSCNCCGAKKDKNKGIILHVDHIKPRSKFPKLQLELSNLQVLCNLCNVGKGAWDYTKWRD